jgi:hypothetical protein
VSRTLPFVVVGLLLACAVLAWMTADLRRQVRRGTAARAELERARSTSTSSMGEASSSSSAEESPGSDPSPSAVDPERLVLGPVTVTGAAAGMVKTLLPRPGEPLLEYRDRVLPLAKAAAAPQRARVQRWRADFEKNAGLDEAQKLALAQAAHDAGDALKDQIMGGVLGGELMPPHVRPMRGVRFTRDLLDTLIVGEQKFRARLSPAQQQALDAGRFDFADYVLFSTRWEDLLGVTE